MDIKTIPIIKDLLPIQCPQCNNYGIITVEQFDENEKPYVILVCTICGHRIDTYN